MEVLWKPYEAPTIRQMQNEYPFSGEACAGVRRTVRKHNETNALMLHYGSLASSREHEHNLVSHYESTSDTARRTTIPDDPKTTWGLMLLTL